MHKAFKAAAFGLCSLWLGAIPAHAEQLIVEYYTSLSMQDTYNSRGVPINSFCGVVQQDRANVHKFGRVDQGDSLDWFFDTPERRALIAGKCQFDPAHHTIENIRARRNGYVRVQVFGEGNTITRVVIVEAAG